MTTARDGDDQMMTDCELSEFVPRAEQVYEATLRTLLDPEHMGALIAIEPESGGYILGATWRDACRAARREFPDQMTHVMGIGQQPALHLG